MPARIYYIGCFVHRAREYIARVRSTPLLVSDGKGCTRTRPPLVLIKVITRYPAFCVSSWNLATQDVRRRIARNTSLTVRDGDPSAMASDGRRSVDSFPPFPLSCETEEHHCITPMSVKSSQQPSARVRTAVNNARILHLGARVPGRPAEGNLCPRVAVRRAGQSTAIVKKAGS